MTPDPSLQGAVERIEHKLRRWVGWHGQVPSECYAQVSINDLRAILAALPEPPSKCALCALGFAPFKAEGIMWHQVNGRDPFRCAA